MNSDQSGSGFRAKAKADRGQAEDFRKLALNYQGEARERMTLLAEYFDALANLHEYTADRLERTDVTVKL